MNIVVILGLAISLAMDAFSVSITSGVILVKPTLKQYLKIGLYFGFFQFIMPIIGFYGGVLFESAIKQYDHWIAFILLGFIGGKMYWESFHAEESGEKKDPTKCKSLILLSIATSIDAAAVGFSFAALQGKILLPSIVIGLICFIFSISGVFLGAKIGNKFGKIAERVGGSILILIGTKILIEHLSVM